MLIDELYNTNVENPIMIAQRIKNANIDKNLCKENTDIDTREKIVESIAGNKEHGSRCEYSFATKYCHWHNASYPIYDGVIAHMLARYNEYPYNGEDKTFYGGRIYLETDNRPSLRKYSYFCDVYNKFIDYFQLKENYKKNFKDVDIFLWSYGKFLNKNEN